MRYSSDLFLHPGKEFVEDMVDLLTFLLRNHPGTLEQESLDASAHE
jgi:hypothetical protein